MYLVITVATVVCYTVRVITTIPQQLVQVWSSQCGFAFEPFDLAPPGNNNVAYARLARGYVLL